MFDRRRQWYRKPPVGTRINPEAPLARGLLGFYALNEGAGLTLRDATRNLDFTAAGFGSNNPRASGPAGRGRPTAITRHSSGDTAPGSTSSRRITPTAPRP